MQDDFTPGGALTRGIGTVSREDGTKMALKIFEANLENVNPALRGEYEKQPDGSYTLKLVDLDEFVHGLKSALRKERETIKELRAKYSVTDDGAEALTGELEAIFCDDPTCVDTHVF